MAKATESEVKTSVSTRHPTTQFQLPDADSTAETTLTQALEFCAQKMGLADDQPVVGLLQRGDPNACQYCHYSIAKQMADSISALDRKVKAVYLVDYDATPEDMCFSGKRITSLIHLIIWAERKTSALDSLAKSLDRALAQRYAQVLGVSRLAHLLDIQVVDDDEVKNRIGYGALLSSLHNQPIPIWER